jgi:hypothetical protein
MRAIIEACLNANNRDATTEDWSRRTAVAAPEHKVRTRTPRMPGSLESHLVRIRGNGRRRVFAASKTRRVVLTSTMSQIDDGHERVRSVIRQYGASRGRRSSPLCSAATLSSSPSIPPVSMECLNALRRTTPRVLKSRAFPQRSGSSLPLPRFPWLNSCVSRRAGRSRLYAAWDTSSTIFRLPFVWIDQMIGRSTQARFESLLPIGMNSVGKCVRPFVSTLAWIHPTRIGWYVTTNLPAQWIMVHRRR